MTNVTNKACGTWSSWAAGLSVLTEHQDPGTTSPGYQLCTWSLCRCEFQCWFLAQGSSQQQELKSWEWECKWWEAAWAEPVTNLVTCLPELLLWGTEAWGVCYSQQIVGIQGFLWVMFPLNRLVAALGIDIKRLISPMFWVALSELSSLLRAFYSSQVSSPGKSCHHPSSFYVFPAVEDHGWVMPRALLPSWSPAFIMDAFCVLWSPFFYF